MLCQWPKRVLHHIVSALMGGEHQSAVCGVQSTEIHSPSNAPATRNAGTGAQQLTVEPHLTALSQRDYRMGPVKGQRALKSFRCLQHETLVIVGTTHAHLFVGWPSPTCAAALVVSSPSVP
jgi:hypothetical protein